MVRVSFCSFLASLAVEVVAVHIEQLLCERQVKITEVIETRGFIDVAVAIKDRFVSLQLGCVCCLWQEVRPGYILIVLVG